MSEKIGKILAIDDKQDNLISLEAIILESFPETEVLTSTVGSKGIDIAIKELFDWYSNNKDKIKKEGLLSY